MKSNLFLSTSLSGHNLLKTLCTNYKSLTKEIRSYSLVRKYSAYLHDRKKLVKTTQWT